MQIIGVAGISSITDPAEASFWSQHLKLAAGHDIVHPADMDAGQAFWELYSPIARGNGSRPFVIGQLGQSLDGRIATPTGSSRYINGPEAILHLHRLRALVDAVIVGVGTVVADDPQLTVREVAGDHPARVVIDPNGRLPPDARMLAEDDCPVLVIQAEERPRPTWVKPVTIPSTGGQIAPAAIIVALATLGFRRLLVEGGAATVSGFLTAGALDRLHISVAPIIIGSGPVGINLPPIDPIDDALRPRATMHRLGNDIVFDCIMTPAQVPAPTIRELLLDSVER